MIRLLSVLLISCFFALSALAEVNVNVAGSGELESLPGIGPAKAGAIIAYRTEHGAFKSLSDLDQVPGIGPATLANIGPLVSFSGADGVATVTDTESAPADGASKPSAADASAINVNTASSSALESLPGIGPAKAAAIIADREAQGPYSSCSDLQRVRGIGPATVANISSRCAVK